MFAFFLFLKNKYLFGLPRFYLHQTDSLVSKAKKKVFFFFFFFFFFVCVCVYFLKIMLFLKLLLGLKFITNLIVILKRHINFDMIQERH